MELNVGDVLYLRNSEITPAKNKYSACVHIKPHYFLLINTKNREMYECLPISQKDNKFLEYDSFISCANYYIYNDDDIRGEKPVGHLGYKDLNALYFHIKHNVKGLTSKIKNEILQSLKDALDDYR